MGKQGGSATVHGILYQMLGSLDWAARIDLKGTASAENLKSATLILEPSDGGDLQTTSEGIRIVEQWKSRTETRSWSIGDVVKEVFPDLYRATGDNQVTEYWFVTEGKCSNWEKALTFFDWASERSYPAQLSEALDALSREQFRGQGTAMQSANEFFAWIVQQTAGSDACHEIDGILTVKDHEASKRVWKLISNFNYRVIHLEEMQAKIDEWLSNFVDSKHDIKSKREQLCSIVLDLARSQNTSIVPSDLLRRADLDRTSLKSWRLAFAKINGDSVRRLAFTGYSSGLDVRSCPSWSLNSSVMLISGESGYGKSYALGSIGHQAISNEHLVITLRATGNALETLSLIGNTLWEFGFERHSAPALQSIAELIRKECTEIDGIWLTVLIEDLVASPEARELLEFDWRGCGIRLAAAVSPTLATTLNNRYGISITNVTMGSFSVLETKAYLEVRGFQWADIPADVREIIRWPLMAQLYCDIAAESTWEPENEYSLFEKTWGRIASDLRQANHQDDQANLQSILQSSSHALCGYPWSTKECRDHGLDSDAVDRLVSIGWLQRYHGRVRVAHHRLLSWGIAVALADDYKQRGEELLPTIQEITRREGANPQRFEGVHLGYVPMDLMWIVSNTNNFETDSAALLLQAFLDANSVEANDSTYRLLPTLGTRVIKPVVGELVLSQLSPLAYKIDTASSCLLEIAKNFPADVSNAAVEMLKNPSLGVALCGASLLRKLPSTDGLDGLWELLDRFDQWKESATESDQSMSSRRRESIQNALASCVQNSPQWIASQLATCRDAPGRVEILAALLSDCDSEQSVEVWGSIKSELISILGGGSIALSRCIVRFNDEESVPLLLEWLESGNDALTLATIDALAVIDPNKLLEQIPRITPWTKLWLNSHWLPTLMAKYRPVLIEQLKLSSVSQDAFHRLGRILEHWLDQLDIKTVRSFLDQLVTAMQEYQSSPGQDTIEPVVGWLRLLHNISAPSLLAPFGEFQGSELERNLILAGIEFAEDEKLHELEWLVSVLSRISSTGTAELVNSLLSNHKTAQCLTGLRWSYPVADEKTLQLLADISMSPRDDTGERPSYGILRDQAIENLATLGDDSLLVQALLSREADILELSIAREEEAPMSDPVIDRIRTSVASSSGKALELSLMASGVTGRQDLVPMLHQQLNKESPESKIAYAALVGLVGLAANDQLSINVFQRHLSISSHNLLAANGLIRANNDSSRFALLKYVEESQNGDFKPDLELAYRLMRFPKTRDRAATAFEKLAYPIDPFKDAFTKPGDYLEILGGIGGDRYQTDLLQAANSGENGLNVVGRRVSAIKGLAKTDTLAATDAAWRAFTTADHNRELYPSLLMRMDGDRFAKPLCDSLLIEEVQLVRRSIGLALRQSKQITLIRDLLKSWLTTGCACKRWAAMELAGWMGPPFLETEIVAVLQKDRNRRVRSAAGYAFYRYGQQKTMTELIADIPKAEPITQWLHLGSLLRLDDAEFLGGSEDLLSIGATLDTLPPAFDKHFRELYKQRIKKLQLDIQHKTVDLPYACSHLRVRNTRS